MSVREFFSNLEIYRRDRNAKNQGKAKDNHNTDSTSASSPSLAVTTTKNSSAESSNITKWKDSEESEDKHLTDSTSASSTLQAQTPTPQPAIPAKSSPHIPNRIWDVAYDRLREKESKLVDAYERLLSQDSQENGSERLGLRQDENLVEQTDNNKRRLRMEQIVQHGLKETEKESKIRHMVGTALGGVLSLKELVSTSLQATPQAALAWSGVCFALQILENPSSEMESNRNGVVHVVSRMKWYCELSTLLLREDAIKSEISAGVRGELEQRVINLYQALLLYLMKSVYSFNRNRFVGFLCDLVKMDAWDEALQSVEAAENAVRQDSHVYNMEQIRLGLEELLNVAKNEEGKLLRDIQSVLQQQLSVLQQQLSIKKQEVSAQLLKEDNACLVDLRITDPSKDKKRIEDFKGGLLKNSYRWILENEDFQKWQGDQHGQLLWINGEPGQGKTMLLCGLIDELKSSMVKGDNNLSYFFCRATEPEINNATSVLRGLLWLLVPQQPSLISHIRKEYDRAKKALFQESNTFTTLSDIFRNILQDPSLNSTHLIIDALDECIIDLPKLLKFIVDMASLSPRVKWIVSSRVWPQIKEALEKARNQVNLSLKLHQESITAAVDTYIEYKVTELAQSKEYDQETQNAVQNHLSSNAESTFLWVALVCQNLMEIELWETLDKLKEFPAGLYPLYHQMLEQIEKSDQAVLCKQILASNAVVHRPITLQELTCLVKMPKGLFSHLKSLERVIGLCGSFLTLRKNTIYFVHQSAQDYLVTDAVNRIFPSGKEAVHYEIFSRSLEVMSRTLRRDIYSLGQLGYTIEKVEPPEPDPLAASRYSCIYWVNHLCAWNANTCADQGDYLQDGGAVDEFLRKKYIYWLEALSLCKSMSDGVVSTAKLDALLQGRAGASGLLELVRDARRFIMYHKPAIEISPLQAYASALIFSPATGLIRRHFKEEEPKWITIKPPIGDKWSACLQTLEGHSDWVRSVAFSNNSARLASASDDRTIKIWDASNGECLHTLEGHSRAVSSVAFSHDWARLASASGDHTIKIWDASTGECLHTLEGHSGFVSSVAFSHDSARLASASGDRTIKIWDASSGEYLYTLEGHSSAVISVTFSHDSAWLASTSADGTIKIWDASSDACLQTLEGHSDAVNSVTFSHDSARLASTSADGTIKIWDASSGECLQTLEGHSDDVNSVAFSHDSARLASASGDRTVKIWDASSSECLHTLEGHSSDVSSVAFSHDSARLASASDDRTVKIWDSSSGAYLHTLEDHSKDVNSVAFSYDSARLTSASDDRTVKIWDASSGECLHTLEGHSGFVSSVAFSYDSARLASASGNRTVEIWDASSGECLHTLEGHSGWVRSIAFSHDSARLASASGNRTVKIWDASSGECLRTLNVAKALHSISFDITGSCLHTDIGTVAVNTPSASSISQDKMEHQNPRYQGVGLSPNGVWITCNSENLVWLPSEYRPSCSAVSGRTIGIGVGSGKVWMCTLQVTGFGRR